MQLQQVIQYLEELAPSMYQEGYDNSGLLVGSPSMEVRACLFSLDCTEAIIEEAIALNCNVIVCHHPIIFGGLKKINGKNYVERVIIAAIKNDIAIYACHTNLDNMLHGVNAKIAEKIALQDVQILLPKKETLEKLYLYAPEKELENVQKQFFALGAGQIGDYSECSFSVVGNGTFKAGANSNPKVGVAGGQREKVNEVKIEIIYNKHLKFNILNTIEKLDFYEEVAFEIIPLQNANQTIGSGIIGVLPEPVEPMEFLRFIKKALNTDCIRHTAILPKVIQRVAICGGSGSFLLPYAKKAKADVYISADFKYHEFFDADNSIIIADIGHFETEQFTPEIFYSYLQNKNCNFALHLSKINTNPIQYF